MSWHSNLQKIVSIRFRFSESEIGRDEEVEGGTGPYLSLSAIELFGYLGIGPGVRSWILQTFSR